MSFVITIDTPRWRAHQDRVRDAITATGATVVPVAKGNGYGVGNVRLAAEARRLGADCVAVGTVHEAPAVLAAEADLDVLVLEPLTLRGEVVAGAWRALAEHPDSARVIHTVASPESAAEIVALSSPQTPRRVVLEGLTSMRRFGMTEDEVAAAITTLAPHIDSGAIRLEGLALHLPIATPEEPRIGSMAMLTSDDSAPQPVVIGSARVHEVVAWGLLWPNLLANLAGLSDAGLPVGQPPRRPRVHPGPRGPARHPDPAAPGHAAVAGRPRVAARRRDRARRPCHAAGPVRRVPPAPRARATATSW